MKKYIPNILTTYRLIVALLLPIFFLNDNYNVLTILYITALISDSLDGILARKWNVISFYGKIVDVIADKAIVIISAVLFTIKISKFFLINLILEIILASINVVRYIKTDAIKKGFTNHQSSKMGKFKTSLIFTTLFVGYVSHVYNILNPIVLPLIIITGIFQILTTIDYVMEKEVN